jgi:hypothetical protein
MLGPASVRITPAAIYVGKPSRETAPPPISGVGGVLKTASCLFCVSIDLDVPAWPGRAAYSVKITAVSLNRPLCQIFALASRTIRVPS